MSQKLSSLVKAADDPNVLSYVIMNLGTGVPGHACFGSAVQHMKETTMALLLSGQWRSNLQLNRLKRQQREIIEDQLAPVLIALRERQLATLLFQQSSMNLRIKHLYEGTPDLLRQKLNDGNPLLRVLVIFIIGQRRLHLEKELIDRLDDPIPLVREAAHIVLVRVARTTDFGPIPGASQKGIARSIEKWHHWLALQHGDSPDSIAEGKPAIVGASGAKIDPAKAVKLVLDHGNRQLQTAPPEVTQLCDELVKSRGEEQMSILTRLRDAKGIDNTDALALAIPKLSAGAAQREARDALAQRLTRMTAKTLRDKLQDDSVEVRRAAALACGRKKADEHIPDLLQLLEDPEVAVIQAARLALKELTGQDFGPEEEAGRRARVRAAAAWRKWCQEHPSEPK